MAASATRLSGCFALERLSHLADVRSDPEFLNKTGRIKADAAGFPIRFMCVPIRIEGRTAGAVAVDRLAGAGHRAIRDTSGVSATLVCFASVESGKALRSG